MFDFKKDHILEDEEVMLRPLLLADFEHIRHFSIDEPGIWKYSFVLVNDPATLRKYVETAVDARLAEKQFAFIVFNKKQSKYAGSTRLYDFDLINGAASIGYTWYGRDFQGTGLNKHCKFLLLQFCFENLGLARVEFRADHNNQRSIAAMKSIGCTAEGVLRENLLLPDGSRRSSIVLSILRDEWFATVKENLWMKL